MGSESKSELDAPEITMLSTLNARTKALYASIDVDIAYFVYMAFKKVPF